MMKRQKQNKRVRGLLAAALLVVALVLPIAQAGASGYGAEEQISAFQFICIRQAGVVGIVGKLLIEQPVSGDTGQRSECRQLHACQCRFAEAVHPHG